MDVFNVCTAILAALLMGFGQWLVQQGHFKVAKWVFGIAVCVTILGCIGGLYGQMMAKQLTLPKVFGIAVFAAVLTFVSGYAMLVNQQEEAERSSTPSRPKDPTKSQALGTLFFEQSLTRMPATAKDLWVLDATQAKMKNQAMSQSTYAVSDMPQALRCRIINDGDTPLIGVHIEIPIVFTDAKPVKEVHAIYPVEEIKGTESRNLFRLYIQRLSPGESGVYEYYVRNDSSQWIRSDFPTEATAKTLDGTPVTLKFRYADISMYPVVPYEFDTIAANTKQALIANGTLATPDRPRKKTRK